MRHGIVGTVDVARVGATRAVLRLALPIGLARLRAQALMLRAPASLGWRRPFSGRRVASSWLSIRRSGSAPTGAA